MLPDEDVDAAARVLPMAAIQVATQPGSVKLIHRSGRVLYTFAGPTMQADGLALIDEMMRVFDDPRRMKREVLIAKPWWKFW